MSDFGFPGSAEPPAPPGAYGGPSTPGWWQASDGNWYPPAPGAPGPGYGFYPGYPAQARGTNGLAIASMVLGILWIYWIGSLLAVIFGHVSLGQIRRTGQEGRGMAIAGLVLGYLGLAVFVVAVIAVLAFGTEASNNFSRIGDEL